MFLWVNLFPVKIKRTHNSCWSQIGVDRPHNRTGRQMLAVGDLNKEELVEKEFLVIFLKELGKAARKEENRWCRGTLARPWRDHQTSWGIWNHNWKSFRNLHGKTWESVKTWGWEFLILCIAGFYISNVMTILTCQEEKPRFFLHYHSLNLFTKFADQPKHNQHGEEVLREFLLCVMTWVYSWSSELLPFCIKLQLQYWNPSSLVHLLWLHYLHSSPLVHLRFVL